MKTDRLLYAVRAEAVKTVGDITETETDCIFRDVTNWNRRNSCWSKHNGGAWSTINLSGRVERIFAKIWSEERAIKYCDLCNCLVSLFYPMCATCPLSRNHSAFVRFCSVRAVSSVTSTLSLPLLLPLCHFLCYFNPVTPSVTSPLPFPLLLQPCHSLCYFPSAISSVTSSLPFPLLLPPVTSCVTSPLTLPLLLTLSFPL